MLTIRLRRMGARNNPFFRVVVSDSRNTPTAAAVEEIGHYDPTKNPAQVTIDTVRADHWLSHGAQMSPTVKKPARTDQEEERLSMSELADDLKELRPPAGGPARPGRGPGDPELARRRRPRAEGRPRRPWQGDRTPGADRPGDAHAARDPRGPAGSAP